MQQNPVSIDRFSALVDEKVGVRKVLEGLVRIWDLYQRLDSGQSDHRNEEALRAILLE